MRNSQLTVNQLKNMLEYDPGTGLFKWLVSPRANVKVGDVAGSQSHGYTRIQIGFRTYAAHRLAWLYIHGQWPTAEVDHRHGVGAGDHFSNLREATRSQNCQNAKRRKDNTSGFKGVNFDKSMNKWSARIQRENRRVVIGYYDTAEAAFIARAQLVNSMHGEFGRPS